MLSSAWLVIVNDHSSILFVDAFCCQTHGRSWSKDGEVIRAGSDEERENRRYAMDRLEQEWSSALRHGRALSCLAIDVDAMPEGVGHSAADRALAMLAGVLRDGVRAHDVLCRIGDTRFLAIAPVTAGPGAIEFATRLRDSVSRRFSPEAESGAPAHARGLTVSIGVASMAKSLRDPESLIQLAETALQTARTSGSAQVYAAS